MSPQKPTNNLPADIKICIVDAMRILRVIPVTNIQHPMLLTWTEVAKVCLDNLPGKVLHVVFDDHSSRDQKI